MYIKLLGSCNHKHDTLSLYYDMWRGATGKVYIMNKIVRFVIVLGLVGIVSACNSTFKSNVSRFHELPKPQGETVQIVPLNPQKNASLEFAAYANIVGSYLGKQGYRPAGNGKADLIVELDYSVDDGKVVVRSYPSAFSFGYGYGFHRPYYYPNYWYSPYWRYSSHYYSPFWGYHDPFERDVRSYVNFTRKLTMIMRPNKAGAKNIFEGTVESVGRSNKLPQLMPLMVQALFTNFPGVNGSTERIVIELDKD